MTGPLSMNGASAESTTYAAKLRKADTGAAGGTATVGAGGVAALDADMDVSAVTGALVRAACGVTVAVGVRRAVGVATWSTGAVTDLAAGTVTCGVEAVLCELFSAAMVGSRGGDGAGRSSPSSVSGSAGGSSAASTGTSPEVCAPPELRTITPSPSVVSTCPDGGSGGVESSVVGSAPACPVALETDCETTPEGDTPLPSGSALGPVPVAAAVSETVSPAPVGSSAHATPGPKMTPTPSATASVPTRPTCRAYRPPERWNCLAVVTMPPGPEYLTPPVNIRCQL